MSLRPALPPRLGAKCPPLQPPSECSSEVAQRPASTPRPHRPLSRALGACPDSGSSPVGGPERPRPAEQGSHTGQARTPDSVAHRTGPHGRPRQAGGPPTAENPRAPHPPAPAASVTSSLLRGLSTDRSKRCLLLASWPRPVTSVHKPEDRDGSEIPAALLHVGLTLAGVVDTVLRKPAGWASVPPKRPGPPLMNTGTPSLPTPPAQGLPWAATYFCIQIQPHKSYCIVSRNLNLCLNSAAFLLLHPKSPSGRGVARRKGNS